MYLCTFFVYLDEYVCVFVYAYACVHVFVYAHVYVYADVYVYRQKRRSFWRLWAARGICQARTALVISSISQGFAFPGAKAALTAAHGLRPGARAGLPSCCRLLPVKNTNGHMACVFLARVDRKHTPVVRRLIAGSVALALMATSCRF